MASFVVILVMMITCACCMRWASTAPWRSWGVGGTPSGHNLLLHLAVCWCGLCVWGGGGGVIKNTVGRCVSEEELMHCRQTLTEKPVNCCYS